MDYVYRCVLQKGFYDFQNATSLGFAIRKVWQKSVILFFDDRILTRNEQNQPSLAGSKVWDWSLGSLEVAWYRRLHQVERANEHWRTRRVRK